MSGAIPKGSVRPKNDGEAQIGEPLDKKILTISNKGVEKKVPALHVGWAENRKLVKYIPPPLDENGIYPPGAQEMWIELLEYLEQELKFLLSLPHHRFWSQIVYDPGVLACLESYLINARRGFDDEITDGFSGLVKEFSDPMEESVHHLVLLVFIRMATYKESKEDHITPSVFGEIIYDNFLFDICKIFDICVLYGRTSPELISKMVGNIFMNQSKYYSDLTETVPTIILTFDNIEEKFGVAENMLPVALSNSKSQLSVEDVHDNTTFLTDTLNSIQMFLTCHPPACKYFHVGSFEIRLSLFYERVIPVMMDILSERAGDPQLELWIAKLVKKIDIARITVLKVFRVLMQHKCFEPLLDDMAGPSIVGECVEKYLQVMSTCIGEKTFIADYCSVYPITDDLEIFKQHGGDVTSLDFITDAVSTVMSEMGLVSNSKVSFCEKPTAAEDKDVSDTSGMNGYIERGCSVPSEVELSSLVSNVQDLLPDLGDGFVQQCLQYYGYSTEAVINALLEDSLPPSLVTLDRSAPAIKMPKPELESQPDLAKTEEKLSDKVAYMERANVYNDDEFDVFSRKEVDRSKIHKGKKNNKHLDYKADEADKEMLKQIARHYDERGGTSIYEDEFRLDENAHVGWEYDDEYDDTYDDNEAGNIDVMTEVIKKRPGIVGAGRLNTHIMGPSSSNSSDEENSEDEEKMREVKKMDDNKRSSVSQSGARPKNLGSKRGVQRIFNKTSSKPISAKQQTPTPEREETKEERPQENLNFCENPEDVRRRAEQRRQDRYRGYRGRGGGGRENHGQENGITDNQYAPRPKTGPNRSSGKSWRQGQSGGDDENRGYHGGKYKEDTNHGKAQSQHHRHKMIHKNEHKRAGAQAKFNRNN